MDSYGLGLAPGRPLFDQALGRLAGQLVVGKKADEHGPGSTGQSSGDITRSHHRQTKSARPPTALRHLAASAAASNHVRSTTVVGTASSSCLLRHALSPVTDRTAWTRSIPRPPIEANNTSNSGSSTGCSHNVW
jgi:3-deoxy-D-arabino-heptulosonate 7-phosphate (DAHP) synthase class II